MRAWDNLWRFYPSLFLDTIASSIDEDYTLLSGTVFYKRTMRFLAPTQLPKTLLSTVLGQT